MASDQTVPEAFASAYQRKLAHRSSLRVKAVREAMIEAAKGDPDIRVQLGLEAMAEMAADETLAKLGRLLK